MIVATVTRIDDDGAVHLACGHEAMADPSLVDDYRAWVEAEMLTWPCQAKHRNAFIQPGYSIVRG